MLCQHCHNENPDDASFCGECGQPLRSRPEQIPPAVQTQAPPPPPPPPPPAQYTAGAQPTDYAPPPPADPRQILAPYMQTSNSSGSGPQAILPEEASGWTFAGCVPFGLFGFMNNLAGWGLLGCVGGLLVLLFPVYFFVIGVSGKQMAWKNQTFSSVEEYRRSMANWNTAGLVFFILGIVYVIAISFLLMSRLPPICSTSFAEPKLLMVLTICCSIRY